MTKKTNADLKILWVSNAPWAATGYGDQTGIFARRIRDAGYQIAIEAFYGLEGAVLNWDGIPVFPRGHEAYGQDIVGAHTTAFGADVVISLMDAWVCNPRQYGKHVNWWPWYPVDSEPLPNIVREAIMQARGRIVMSKFGLEMTQNDGMDAHYIPHGVETKILRPLDSKQARADLKLPADAFIVGMVAANKGTPSRKSFDTQIEAFAMLAKKHDDAVLYIHSSMGKNGEHGGENLPALLDMFSIKHGVDLTIGKNVFHADPYGYILGYPKDRLASIYNALDVLTNVSMGEGFGIPIVEAQACGTPVIVGDWTAMGELCFSGWKVDKSEALAVPIFPIGAWQFKAPAGAIYERMEAAYNMRGNQEYRKRAVTGAAAYDADKVFAKYFLPTLQAIQESIK